MYEYKLLMNGYKNRNITEAIISFMEEIYKYNQKCIIIDIIMVTNK